MLEVREKVDVKLIIVFTLITFISLVTHEDSIAIVITIPQLLIVSYFLIKNDLEKSYLYHIAFSLTCLSIPYSSIVEPGQSYALYNYTKLKLLGPVGFSLLLSLIILFRLLLQHKFKISKLIKTDPLFFKLAKVLVFFMLYGVLVGSLGLFFFDNNKTYFVTYSAYIIPVIINCLILILLYSNLFCNKVFTLIYSLLISAPFASLLCSIIGFRTYYGDLEIVPLTEVAYYSPILLLSIFYDKNKLAFTVGLISFYLMLDGGTGGKGVIFALLILIIFIYKLIPRLIFASNRICIFILLSLLLFYIVNIDFSEYGLFFNKIESVLLLAQIFSGPEALYLIPESPRIRIISFISIVYPLFINPFEVIFGRGYGGYFTDVFGLFGSCTMKNAFLEEELATGRFASAHDTIASVPLLNGLFGLFLLVKIGVLYLKRLSINFFSVGAFLWLILSFYYNSQFALVGLLMMYVSSVKQKI